jgi:DNA-binding PadR family transcriptional regulator
MAVWSQLGPGAAVGEDEDDLLEQLVISCVLLLLHETPASSEELHEALAALRLNRDREVIQGTLELMEDAGLVFSTWGASATAPGRHTFHIAPAGSQWLVNATARLRSTEGFLGAFVARCGERLVPPAWSVR